MYCKAIIRGKECGEKATHIGTVLTKEDGLIEVTACAKHAKRKGFFGEKINKEGNE